MKRRHRGNQYVWTDGVVHGFLGYIDAPGAPLIRQTIDGYQDAGRVTYIRDYADTCILRVTSNGKVWSYALSSMAQPYTIDTPGPNQGKRSFNIHFANHYLPKDARHNAISSLSTLTSEYRPAVEWARKDIAKRAKLPATDPDALQLDVAYDTEAPSEAAVKLPGPFGSITYTGFSKKVGHYTLEQIHEICSKAVAASSAIWTYRDAPGDKKPSYGDAKFWVPANLEIMLHSGKAALGLAFAPGTGRYTNKRTISLNATLFKLFDAHSTWRVVVHELCHHYRDEVFEKHEVIAEEQAALLAAIKSHMATSPRGGMWWHNVLSTHDATFVRELGRVDPKVRESAYSGLLFTEYADPSLVAEMAAKKAVRAASVKPVEWNPLKGRLYFDRIKGGRELTVWWIPLTKGDWRPVREPLINSKMRQVIHKLGPGWAQTRCTYSDNWYAAWNRPETLGETAKLFTEVLGMFLGDIPNEAQIADLSRRHSGESAAQAPP